MKLTVLALVLSLLAVAVVLADPDLPGHVSPTETLEKNSLFIPMDRKTQGYLLKYGYKPNGSAQNNTFNMRAYGLVNALLWADIPVKWIIKNGKIYDDDDFCALTYERFPTDERTLSIASQRRCFKGGPFAIPSTYTTIAETVIKRFTAGPAYAYSISYTVNAAGKKIVTITPTTNLTADQLKVRVYRLDENVQVNVRYTLYSRPFAAVLDSSKYFLVEARNLIASGFIPGQHFTVMTKEEAAAFTGDTCVTFATEPHFLVSQEDNHSKNVTYPNSFVSAVRKFIKSGGNFLAQCGGLSTYEQCDNVKPNGYNGRACPPTNNASVCPDGYFVTTRGVYEVSSAPTSGTTGSNFVNGRCPEETTGAVPVTPLTRGSLDWDDGDSVKIQHADIPVNQFDGSWTYEQGVTPWFSLWKKGYPGSAYGGVDSNWNTANFAHPLVEATDRNYSAYGCTKRSVEEEQVVSAAQGCDDYDDCGSCYANGCVFCQDKAWPYAKWCRKASNNCTKNQNYLSKSTTCPTTTATPSPTGQSSSCKGLVGVYFGAHAKLNSSYDKTGGNIFYLAGHEYDNTNGRRMFMNAVLHPSERSRNCTTMITVCDSNGQNCVDVPKPFYIDPCAYVTPDWLKNNLTNTSFPAGTLSAVDGLINSDVFDTPSPVLKNTTIVPLCQTKICITYLNATVRHDSFGYFLFNMTTKQIISQQTLFPDVSSNSTCLNKGATICIGPFPAGTVIGWWVAVNGIYSANPQYIYSLDPNGLLTSNFIRFGYSTTSFLAFSSTSDETDPYNDLLVAYNLTTPSCATPPVFYVNDSCATFDPAKYATEWYKASCIDYVPLNVGEEQCGTPIAIPDGWIIAPVDSNFNQVISNYSNNWPAGCYQGTAGTATGYGSFQGCTPTHTTYSTFINGLGQVCIRADCSDHLLLQSQTVDTRCHPDNYDQYCSFDRSSTVFDQNPLLPGSVFVNLVSNKPVSYVMNPGLAPLRVEIMFLLDVNNLAKPTVAKSYWRDYIEAAINQLPSNLNVGFGYAWSDGVLRGGLGISYDRKSIATWTDPTCNFGTCTSTNILSILAQLASSPNAGWTFDPNTPHHRIIFVMTGSTPNSGDINATLAKALSDNNITPLFTTLTSLTTSYNAVKNAVSWAVLSSTSVSSMPDVTVTTAPSWVAAFPGDIATIRNAVTAFVDSDTWGIITRTNTSSLNLTFSDKTFTSTPTTSAYPTNAPGTNFYNHKINLCSYGGSYPANTSETLQYIDYWSFGNYTNTDVLGTCECAERPSGTPLSVFNLKTRSQSIMNLPAATHQGPTVRIFGRVNRQTYVTVARDPSYANPEIYATGVEGGQVSVPVFANPSELYGENEHRVYMEVLSVTNAASLTKLTLLDGSATSLYGPYTYQTGPYEVCNLSTSKGFVVQGAKRFCRIPDGASGAVPRGRPANWGETMIYYRFCDGCNCAAGPISRKGGAWVKVNFTCGPDVPPVGEDITYRLLPGQTIPVNITAHISDVDDVISDLFIKFSQLQPAHGVLKGADNSTLENNVYLYSNQQVQFTNDQYSIQSVVYYTVQDPLGGTSPTYKITFIPYQPPTMSVTPSSLTVKRTETGTFTFTLADVDSSYIDFNIAALQRQNVPLPSTFTYTGPGGSVNVLTLDPATTIARIPNPNPGTPITVTLKWTPDVTIPDGATGTIISTLVDSEGLSAIPVSIKVSVAPNNVPTCAGTSGVTTYLENSDAHNVTVSGTDADSYHLDHLKVKVVQLPTLGKLTLSDGSDATLNTLLNTALRTNNAGAATTYLFTYKGNNDTFGKDSFCVVFVDDLNGQSALCCTNLTITHVNKPPTAHNVSITLLAGDNTTFTIQGSDPDLTDPITLFINNDISAVEGTVKQNSNTISAATSIVGPSNKAWTFQYFAPPAQGNYTFTYYVFDGTVNSVETYVANITVLNVIPPNLPPSSANLTVITNEDTKVNINLTQVISDPDGDALIVTIVNPPNSTLGKLVDKNGNEVTTTVIPEPDGTVILTFIPASNEFGNTTFTYFVTDTYGLNSNTSTVTIAVLPVPDPPTIVATPLSLVLDRLAKGDISFTTSDIDSTVLTVTIVNASIPALSNLTYSATAVRLPDGTSSQLILTGPQGTSTNFLSWIPLELLVDGSTGTFQLMVTDETNLSALSEVIHLAVTPNKAPFTTAPTQPYTALENENVSIAIAASDPDLRDQQVLTLTLTSLPKYGDLYTSTGVKVTAAMLNVPLPAVNVGPIANGTQALFTYVPVPLYNGNDSFTFEAKDPLGLVSDNRQVDIILTPVDQPPTSEDVSVTVKQNVCIAKTCNVISTQVNTTQIFANDPDKDVTVLMITRLPDAANGTLMYLDQSTNTWYPVEEIHPDLVFPATESWVFSYQPTYNQYGLTDTTPFATFDFLINTPAANSSSYLGTVYVLHVNQPPTCGDRDVYTNMSTPVSFSIPHDDIDSPSSELRLVAVDLAYNNRGEFAHSPSGVLVSGGDVSQSFDLSFSPELNVYSNPLTTPIGTFTYRVVDENGDGLSSSVCTARVYVLFVPLNITYTDQTVITIPEDTTASFFVDRFGIDWFGGNEGFQVVTTTIVDQTGNGTLMICPPGTNGCEPLDTIPTEIPAGSMLKFVPVPNENGDNYYTVTITLKPKTDAPPITVTWTINVTPINDPPVLIPLFSIDKANPNVCDEDTFIVIRFDGSDIDSPIESLKAHFIGFLDQNVHNKLYLCDGDKTAANVKLYDGCAPGTLVPSDGLVFDSLTKDAKFEMLFVPDPNLNGKTRFIVSIQDDFQAESVPVPVEIVVLPINDPPQFDKLNGELGYDIALNSSIYTITGKVSDIDFKFGKRMELTISAENQTSGVFAEPPATAPCQLTNENRTLICNALITELNSWFAAGFIFVPAETAETANITLIINDLGNIDKFLIPNATYAELDFNRTIGSALTATAAPASDNTALIAAPIAGLLGGIGIVALVWFLRAKKSGAAVDSYFARLALDMEGTTNTSPLYQGAAKGGESALYEAKKS